MEVVSRFHDRRVHPILLKGAALRSWLYADESQRTYIDTDLLVAPEDRSAAEDCLQDLGFVRAHSDEVGSATTGDCQWIRDADGAMLDLHGSLVGAGATGAAQWTALSSSPARMWLQGVRMRILSEPARALHVALHAAQHGPAIQKPLADLARALEVADRHTWMAAAGLAEGIDATAAFSAGLRLLPAGAALADELKLPTSLPLDVALLAAGAPPEALTVQKLARTPGLKAKLRLIGRKVVPTPQYMRSWYPSAARRRRALVVGYLYRPLWLISKAGPAWRAWRRARTAQTR